MFIPEPMLEQEFGADVKDHYKTVTTNVLLKSRKFLIIT